VPAPEPRRSLARRAAETVAPPLRRLIEDRDRLRKRETRLERALAAERRRVRDLRERLARLEQGGTGDGGERTELGYLFIVSYGRSGSTLLQGLLNTIPGYLIRGENRMAPYRLWQFHETLFAARKQFGRAEALTPRDSYYGIDEYRSTEALARMRSMLLDCLLRPADDTRVVGFKEIRWFQSDWQDYVRFLGQVFPGARFVINTRDHAGVVKSHWWTKMDRDEALEQLAGHEKQFDEMAEMLGTRAFRVHYDDYIADPSRLEQLWHWLGEPFDRASIDAALDVRHSF
jgi:hypothetical protein